MPRKSSIIKINNGEQSGKGWFMDFKEEAQQHLGTIGGDEPEFHNYVYLHSSFGFS